MCYPISEMCHICLQDHNCCNCLFYPLREDLLHEYTLVSNKQNIFTTNDYDEAYDVMCDMNKTYKYTPYEVTLKARRVEEVAR